MPKSKNIHDDEFANGGNTGTQSCQRKSLASACKVVSKTVIAKLRNTPSHIEKYQVPRKWNRVQATLLDVGQSTGLTD